VAQAPYPAHQIVRHLLEDEEDDSGWKDVTPEVEADHIERWCFTKHDLTRPQYCRSTDEFLADGGCEMEVIMLRNGKVTSQWGDGTSGVPERVQQIADTDESPLKPSWANKFNQFVEDDYADTWRDVYVNSSGDFLGFVPIDGRSMAEAMEDEDDDDDDLDRDQAKDVSLGPLGLRSPINPGGDGTVPHRIVLHRPLSGRGWAVHTQNMRNGSFAAGAYFQDDEYQKAVQNFQARCRYIGVDPVQAERVMDESIEDEDDADLVKDIQAEPRIATLKDFFDGDTMSYGLYIDGKLHHFCWSTNEARAWVKANGCRWANEVPGYSHIPNEDDEQNESLDDDDDDFAVRDILRSDAYRPDSYEELAQQINDGGWQAWPASGIGSIIRHKEVNGQLKTQVIVWPPNVNDCYLQDGGGRVIKTGHFCDLIPLADQLWNRPGEI
jgi:hypothetical protein